MLNDDASVPNHIGFILDGNRRWAKERGLPSYKGHLRGFENLWPLLDAAAERGIPNMTAYAFSTENWRRSSEEVGFLMKLILKAALRDLPRLQKYNMRLRWLGSREDMDSKVREAIEQAEQATAANTGGQLGICINHGGHREITEAVRRIVQESIPAADITEQTIAEHLDAPDLPPLDLIIRTSGEQRLSNFMLWRAAYSELVFVDKAWPDFTPADLDDALAEYARRQRRIGS